jgi:hypothetical protein
LVHLDPFLSADSPIEYWHFCLILHWPWIGLYFLIGLWFPECSMIVWFSNYSSIAADSLKGSKCQMFWPAKGSLTGLWLICLPLSDWILTLWLAIISPNAPWLFYNPLIFDWTLWLAPHLNVLLGSCQQTWMAPDLPLTLWLALSAWLASCRAEDRTYSLSLWWRPSLISIHQWREHKRQRLAYWQVSESAAFHAYQAGGLLGLLEYMYVYLGREHKTNNQRLRLWQKEMKVPMLDDLQN